MDQELTALRIEPSGLDVIELSSLARVDTRGAILAWRILFTLSAEPFRNSPPIPLSRNRELLSMWAASREVPASMPFRSKRSWMSIFARQVKRSYSDWMHFSVVL